MVLKTNFCFSESGRFRQVLLYVMYQGPVKSTVYVMGSNFLKSNFIKMISITNLQSICPQWKHIFVTFYPLTKADSFLLVAVGDTDK